MTATGSALQASALGLQFAFSVFVGFGIGYGLDRFLHTAPWLMLVFLLLGIAAGFVSIVRAVKTGSGQS